MNIKQKGGKRQLDSRYSYIKRKTLKPGVESTSPTKKELTSKRKNLKKGSDEWKRNQIMKTHLNLKENIN